MGTYVLLTKLSADSLGSLKRRGTVGKRWLDEVKKKCPDVKWLEHYALLGPFDFMDIYEAPNDETAMKVSMITMSKGAVKAESWPAVPYRRFLKLAGEL